MKEILDNEKAERLAFFMLKKVNRAVREFGMIEDGDKIAVALSGGKDSFSLLRILQYRQKSAPENYSLCSLHVLGDSRGPDTPAHPPLEDWLKAIGIEYMIRPTYLAEDEKPPIPCERCTRNRRRTLLEMAKETGCNKIAFGHHLDDLAETALLNLINHGKNETIAPTRRYFDTITIIRPMVYVPEREIKRLADASAFPPPPPPCPLAEHTERRQMKELLTELTRINRRAAANLARSALKGR